MIEVHKLETKGLRLMMEGWVLSERVDGRWKVVGGKEKLKKIKW